MGQIRPQRRLHASDREDRMDYLQIGSSWLHLVATVVLLGYVGVIGLVVLPVLRRHVDVATVCELTVAFERRALPTVVAALVAFLATGVYLTVSDARYGGAGDVTGSPWAGIITLKHGLVAVVLGLGLYADGLIARKLARVDAPDRGAAVARLERVLWAMTVVGAAVLLLTAVAAAAR
jgi:uncharacterized membrane protein